MDQPVTEIINRSCGIQRIEAVLRTQQQQHNYALHYLFIILCEINGRGLMCFQFFNKLILKHHGN